MSKLKLLKKLIKKKKRYKKPKKQNLDAGDKAIIAGGLGGGAAIGIREQREANRRKRVREKERRLYETSADLIKLRGDLMYMTAEDKVNRKKKKNKSPDRQYYPRR